MATSANICVPTAKLEEACYFTADGLWFYRSVLTGCTMGVFLFRENVISLRNPVVDIVQNQLKRSMVIMATDTRNKSRNDEVMLITSLLRNSPFVTLYEYIWIWE